MKLVFPPEITEYSIETHFERFSKKSNLIYLVVLLSICMALASLFIIKAEITIQSRGILRSSSESVSLVSPVVAKVSKTVIAENKFVLKGDTLLWFDCEKLDERILHEELLIAENAGYLEDIMKLMESKYSDLNTDLFKSTYARYRQKLIEFDLSIRLQNKLYLRSKQLFDKEVIPIVEMEEAQFALEKIRKERENFIETSRNEWENLAVTYTLENKNYHNEIQNLKAEKKKYIITAPVSGHITQFAGVRTGSFVTIGETIAKISPDSQIIAEQLVPPKDIGYLKTGMPVIIQVDAYNYNQWGLASGKIADISNEVYLINNQPYFKVRSSIDQKYLNLKNGYKGELRKGLTVTSRFKVTKRTLAQLLFDKTDDWLNPKIISE